MTEVEIKFAQDQIKLTKYLNSLDDDEHIEELCSMHKCNEKIRKIHKDEFLHKRWNPHPSERFVRWWMNRGWQEVEEATDQSWHVWNDRTQRNEPIVGKAVGGPVRVYNCEKVRECYQVFLREQRAEMQF